MQKPRVKTKAYLLIAEVVVPQSTPVDAAAMAERMESWLLHASLGDSSLPLTGDEKQSVRVKVLYKKRVH